MSTLLLRLTSPLQSWGVNSKFDWRYTERMPSKSAVIGLIASALGIKRNGDINENICDLLFGVRVDNEGMLLKDFHTVQNPDNKTKKIVTNRYYLADAVFLAGLEGDVSLLSEIEQALRFPVFPLFLGRRSCPPEGQVVLGIREKSLLDALREEPWLVSEYMQKKAPSQISLRIFADAEETDQDAFFQRDVPISFNQEHRQFGFRRVAEQRDPVTITNQNSYRASTEDQTDHDAYAEVEAP